MVQAHSQQVEAQPLTHLALPAIQLGNHEHDSDHVELYERWSREHHSESDRCEFM